MREQRGDDVIICLVGNKTDLNDKRLVKKMELNFKNVKLSIFCFLLKFN